MSNEPLLRRNTCGSCSNHHVEWREGDDYEGRGKTRMLKFAFGGQWRERRRAKSPKDGAPSLLFLWRDLGPDHLPPFWSFISGLSCHLHLAMSRSGNTYVSDEDVREWYDLRKVRGRLETDIFLVYLQSVAPRNFCALLVVPLSAFRSLLSSSFGHESSLLSSLYSLVWSPY